MSNIKKNRITSQKQIIIEELRKTKIHPTADQLFQTVREKLPRISLGTVYRNLDIMSKEMIILKLDFGDGKKHFDGDTCNHYHIYCTSCEKVDDLAEEAVKEFEINPQLFKNYKITGHCINFFGICNECLLKIIANE